MAEAVKAKIHLAERLALSIPEAAASLGISEGLMRTHMPPHCRIGNRVVIPVSLLDEWLRKQAQEEQNVVGKAVNDILEEINSH